MSQLQEQNDLQNLKERVQRVLDEAAKRNASSAEAVISMDSGLSVTARMGEIETLEHHKDNNIAVNVYFGQCKGSASSSDLSDKAIQETVSAACNIARFTAGDPYAGLADRALMAFDYENLDLDHPWSLSAEQAIEQAIHCEDAARKSPEISNSEGASVSTLRGASIYGNSHGFIGGYYATRHSLSCAVIGSHNGSMQRDYWYSSSRDSKTLDSAESVGQRAAERTLRRLGARKLSTRHIPVIFEADVARGLISHFVNAVSGGALYRKATFLLDALGDQVFPEYISIREQPHILGALGSAPFDNEGVATREREIVKGGVLEGYFLSSYSARKLGMQTTGNAGGVRNLTVTNGELDRTGLLKQMHTGLMVTELIGHGVNTVTGDYSRGASGFWVENGEIQYPIEEITIAANLKDMFMNIVAVANDVDTRGNIRTGSILIEKMTIGGE